MTGRATIEKLGDVKFLGRLKHFGGLAGHVQTILSCSRFLPAIFQFGKRPASEAAKFGCGGFRLLGVVGAARLECGEPATEAGKLFGRQLGDCFSDLFDFHALYYSTGI
ncbi:MAG: hypothetical protein WBE14_07830 [Xanthobacteraceae bacterium]